MNGVSFDNLNWLHLLWAVAAVAAIGVYGAWQRQRGLRMFASARLRGVIAPRGGWGRPILRLSLICLCLVAITAAVIGPRWGEVEQRVAKRGIDIIVLLDVSKSMLAKDIAPNRLERAKIWITDDLLPALGGDRIGLITFAGLATLKCPLTSDYGFFRLALEEVDTNSSPKGGTMIGDAIRKAKECFHAGLDTHKVVLLITDGEDQDSFPVDAAQNLWTDAKIPIVAVALGDPAEGARVPVLTNQGEKYLEHGGEVVWSKANFDQLRKIANVSDLKAFIPVGTRNTDLGEIYRTKIVRSIETKERTELGRVQQPSQYHMFALAALMLLLIESVIPGPRRASQSVISMLRGEKAA